MTVEELLKPRWKVIDDYPMSDKEWEVGQILDRDWSWDGDDENGFKYSISKYPRLFKKLEWWEERAVEDMPKYVKSANGVVSEFITFSVIHGFFYLDDLKIPRKCNEWKPATKEEYDSQNK